MDTWWQAAGVVGVALLFAGEVTNAVDLHLSDTETETFDFDIPALPLRRATEAFARSTGLHTYIGHEAFDTCGDFKVGPVVGRLTAKEGWRRLTAPICAASGAVKESLDEAPVYMLDHPWVIERAIYIPRAPLSEALSFVSLQFDDLPLVYRAADPTQAQQLIGPIEGTMGPEEALERIEAQLGSSLHHRRDGPYALVLESDSGEEAPNARRYLYGRTCACPVRIEPLVAGAMTVEGRAIKDRVVTYTRKEIEATGAATLPQFFRFLAVNGYSRPEGHVASGTQYADFRGLGRDTHLITINGRRTLPSANNVTSSAFDLNTIPLPAVDHVDLRLDSASMRTGADAIAGTIDIVTRRDFDGDVTMRYGWSEGGAEEKRTTVSFGHQGGAGSIAALVDYFELGGLLGSQRPLSRDQDYGRYGGTDFRSAFAIRSTNGANLPGLASSVAGIPSSRQSEALSIAELMPGEPQRVSLSSYQSLVPSGARASMVGAADYVWPNIKVAFDLLLVKRQTQYQYYPAIASGTVSADHPGNPFEVPVRIDALLTGAPAMDQHVDSGLRRMVLSARGQLGPWDWDLAALDSHESAEAWVDHMVDRDKTQAALAADDERWALDVFARRPGASAPESIWMVPVRQRFVSFGNHLIGSLERPIGRGRLQLGLERRAEVMQFSNSVGRVGRDVLGKFAHLTWPLVEPEMKVPGMRKLTALAAVREDAFSDSRTVRPAHLELTWSVTDHLFINGNVAEQYRPPSLFELNLPAIPVPGQIYDPKRNEAVSAVILAGGNPHLKPTTGKSTDIKATYTSDGGLTASLNYFSIRLWDRIAALPTSLVIAAEKELPDRVLREPTPDELAADKPGRITWVNTTRANVGRLFTRGLDFRLQKRFDATIGALMPQLDLTWIDAFEYSDSPALNAPMTDRVGEAAEQGTITPWRAVVSLGWERGAWEATTHLRLIPSYRDSDGSRIRSQQLWDFYVSYSPNSHVTFSLAAMDVANTSPHFARIGAATGYDSSQWDPVGRRVMVTAKVSR